MPCMGPIGSQACTLTWPIASHIAQYANGISYPHHLRKSFAGWAKVAHHSLDGASMQWVHSHRMKDGNHYHLFTMDPFSKWVETHVMPLLHSWRAAKFLYDDLVAHWRKPRYIHIHNSTVFASSFAQLYKELGIIHHHITIGNSKANGQVERMSRRLKNYI